MTAIIVLLSCVLQLISVSVRSEQVEVVRMAGYARITRCRRGDVIVKLASLETDVKLVSQHMQAAQNNMCVTSKKFTEMV